MLSVFGLQTIVHQVIRYSQRQSRIGHKSAGSIQYWTHPDRIRDANLAISSVRSIDEIDICDMQLSVKQRWALMIATVKEDLKDLVVKQARIEVRQQDFVQAVPHQPAVPANADGEGGREEVAEVLEVEAQDPLVPT